MSATGAVLKLQSILIWNDVKLVGYKTAISDFVNFENSPKISKIFNIFFFFKIVPLNITIFKKTYHMLEGNGWWICAQNFKSVSSKMAEIWPKTCQKQALFTSFRDFTDIFLIVIFDWFWRFKKCLRVIFHVFLRKSDLKTCIAPLNHECFCLTFFSWWPEMTFTSIVVTKHSKWYLQMSETLSMPISWLCL